MTSNFPQNCLLASLKDNKLNANSNSNCWLAMLQEKRQPWGSVDIDSTLPTLWFHLNAFQLLIELAFHFACMAYILSEFSIAIVWYCHDLM